MPEIIRKALQVEVKDVGSRVLELIGSNEGIDRDGELIKAAGWQLDNYRKNPVVLWAHDYHQPPIGKAVGVDIKDGHLLFRVEFAPAEAYPFADTIYRLYKGGFLSATSVGFIPIETEDGETLESVDGKEISIKPSRTFIKQELLELSAVPVPSNPEALIQARAQGILTVKELQQITGVKKVLKAELIQLVEEQEAEIESLKKCIAELENTKIIPEEKPYPSEHTCRIHQPGEFQPDSFRRMKRDHEGKQYSVIVGRLKGENTMTEQAYRYPKDTWRESEAASHCKSHKGSFEAASGESEAIDVIVVEEICPACLEIEHMTNEQKEIEERKAMNALLAEITAQAWANALGE